MREFDRLVAGHESRGSAATLAQLVDARLSLARVLVRKGDFGAALRRVLTAIEKEG